MDNATSRADRHGELCGLLSCGVLPVWDVLLLDGSDCDLVRVAPSSDVLVRFKDVPVFGQ
jgi:hypothetical protein